MAEVTITQDMLPDGWTIDDMDFHGSIVLRASRGRGFLSINLERRAWDVGTCSVHRKPKVRHVGRGWVQALLDEAIAEFDVRWAD